MGLIIKPLAMLATGNLRGLFSFLLVIALFGALWETSLVNLSSRATATAVMTEVGIEVVNPALQRGSAGLSEVGWAALQAQAIANPTKPVASPGLKVTVLGSKIAHKNFTDGTRVIYGAVAQAYYDGGAGAVFSAPGNILPSGLLPSLIPGLGGSSSGSKPSTGPQLPAVPLPPLGAVGLSPTILTAAGHRQALSLDEWLIGAALLLALLLVLSSRRWAKLGNVAWSFIVAAVPGLVGIGLVWVSVTRAPASFSAVSGLLKLLSGVFVPVYAGSAAAGVAGLVVTGLGGVVTDLVSRSLRRRKTQAQVHAWSQPQAAPRYVPGVPTPSYGGPQDFGKSWPDSAFYPPDAGGAGRGATDPFPSRGAPAPGGYVPSGSGAPPRPAFQSPRPQPGYQPGYQPRDRAPDPYAPLPPLGPQDRGGGGGWPPPALGPADTTWPAPGRPAMPSPRPSTPDERDNWPWPRPDDASPWPPSGR